MDILFIFKIAAIAITVAIVNQLLQKAGKEEYTLIITIAGLLIVLLMFIPVIEELKSTFSSLIDF